VMMEAFGARGGDDRTDDALSLTFLVQLTVLSVGHSSGLALYLYMCTGCSGVTSTSLILNLAGGFLGQYSVTFISESGCVHRT